MAVENGVKKQKVTFHNRFLIDVVGDLYFPANYDPAKKYAAIIVGHPSVVSRNRLRDYMPVSWQNSVM